MATVLDRRARQHAMMRAVLAAAGALVFPAWAAAQAANQPAVTFARDIAPILQQHCQTCHHPNSIAPMSLLTYEDTRPWARSIRDKMSKREMPPWFIDKNIGIQRFKEDPSLTDPEIATIAAWVTDGAPRGNPPTSPRRSSFRIRTVDHRRAGSDREVAGARGGGDGPGRVAELLREVGADRRTDTSARSRRSRVRGRARSSITPFSSCFKTTRTKTT